MLKLGIAIVVALLGLVGLLTFLLTGAPPADPGAEAGPGLRFDDLTAASAEPARLEPYPTRDGGTHFLRRYPAPVSRTLVLIHGSGNHSAYLAGIGLALAAAGAAEVITPDLRGHGYSPERRGDIDSQEQLVEDLVDLITWLREARPRKPLILGGHSSGGGLALRFAGTHHGSTVDALLLLSPYLHFDAPTMRPGSGGWAHPATGRIIALSILNGIGIHALDHLPVISFQMPEALRDGTETLQYTHRLNTGLAPVDYAADLASWKKPLLVLVGAEDEAFLPHEFEGAVLPHAPHATVELLPGVSHLGIAADPRAVSRIQGFVQDL
jgi:non-heme chloroperoxidase